jgi:hypothetical protein
VCIRFVAAPNDLPNRCRTNAARRGFLDEPRNATPSGPANETQLNVALGLDHAVAPWTQLPAPPNGPPTSVPCNGQPGTTLSGAGLLAVNCVSVSVDVPGNDIETGFFGTDGRLRRTDSCAGAANTGGSAQGYSGFDGNSLFQDAFLSSTTGATTADLHTFVTSSPGPVPPLLEGALSSSVLQCPRLVLLPVVAVPGGGSGNPSVPAGGGTYPVVAMKYLWLGNDASDNGFVFSDDGQLIAIRGWLLDPALFSSQVSKSLGLDPYAGPGLPRQVRLVHDRDDSQPAMTPPLGPG